MLIKRQHAQKIIPTEAPAVAPSSDVHWHQPLPDAALEPSITYTSQALAMGLLPERRKRSEPRADGADRRQGWRRDEDLHKIKTATQEADWIKETAYNEGYQAGLQAAEAELASQLQELSTAIEQLQAARPTVTQKALESVLDQVTPLAITLAERIIHTEISCDPTLVVALARDLLAQVDVGQKDLVLKINPAQVALMQEAVDNNPSWKMGGRQIWVTPDEQVEPGSCLIETVSGLIDGTFKTQLAITKQLLGIAPPVV